MDGWPKEILDLWNEGLTIDTIAQKLGIDSDAVANEVEDRTNYPPKNPVGVSDL
jgi:hypothetical protein